MFQCEYCGHDFTTHNHKVMHENECPYNGAKVGFKFCKACGNEVILTGFNRDMTRYDNLNSQCKKCTRLYRNNWATDFSNVPIGII